MNQQIDNPIKRSYLRKIIGREFYILKRRWHWISAKKRWSKPNKSIKLEHEVIIHKSLILRKLKEVEMCLQENKRTNLRLAIQHLDNTIIKPGKHSPYGNLLEDLLP